MRPGPRCFGGVPRPGPAGPPEVFHTRYLFAVTEVVRTAISPDVRLRTRRSLDERLFVRWPRIYVAFARAFFLLPPRSRLRRALLRRQLLSGWSAWSRGDLNLMLVRYAPDYQSVFAPEFVTVGLSSSYRGHAGVREWTADLSEAWEQGRARKGSLVLFAAFGAGFTWGASLARL